jgi:hypothetical protein
MLFGVISILFLCLIVVLYRLLPKEGEGEAVETEDSETRRHDPAPGEIQDMPVSRDEVFRHIRQRLDYVPKAAPGDRHARDILRLDAALVAALATGDVALRDWAIREMILCGISHFEGNAKFPRHDYSPPPGAAPDPEVAPVPSPGAD